MDGVLVADYLAVADWYRDGQAGLADLWVYPRGEQVSLFSDMIEAATVKDVPGAATARLARAGWRVIGDWQRDANTWRVPVEQL